MFNSNLKLESNFTSPSRNLCSTFKCCALFFFFLLNKTFCSNLNIRHAYLVFTGSPPFCQSQQRQQHQSLHLPDLKHQILLWQRPSSPMAPICLSLSLSFSLWVALLMVLKSKIVWQFVYTEGSKRWRIRYLRKFWMRSCHGFCRSARRPSIPITITKTTYGTSVFGYSWYFTNPSLFLFLFFRFLLDDFESGLLGFLEVVWFLWKWRGKMWKLNLDAL